MFFIVLIMLSAFFSSTETAYSSMNTIRMRNYADNGNKKAKIALKISDNYDKAISTILIGNNIVNIAAASLATVVCSNLLGPDKGAAVSTIITTILVLIFGEILPKSFAKANSEKVALGVSRILNFLMVLFKPLVAVFSVMTNSLNKRVGNKNDSPSVTEEELKYIIESIEEEGVLEEEESDLVQSAIDFGDITVQEILTPRVDIEAIDVDGDPKETIEMLMKVGLSRLPVYEKSIDKIIGIVRVKDVLVAAIQGQILDFRNMATECLFVHKTMKISKLLTEFQMKKIHMAIVTDDYGGTMGLVTMEDILEQLVGDIWDESDEEEKYIEKTGDNTYEVLGDLNIYEMLEYIDFDERHFDSDYNTVGGWVLEQFQYIPKVGESFDFENLHVTVLELDDQRIIKVRLEVTPLVEETDD